MGYSWVAVEARTGKIIADLPLLSVDSIKQSLSRYETTTGTLPITAEDAPTEWLRATTPSSTHLVLLKDNPDDSARGIPIAGFRITRRRRGHGDTVSVDMASIESYFDCRFVGNKTYTGIGQCAIVADLISTYVADANGIPISTVVIGTDSTTRDRTYLATDDKTIYSILTDLTNVSGGPEWFVGWKWLTSPERLVPVLYVGNRIGSTVPAGLSPAVTFEAPGFITEFELVEDYGQGKGATDVMAVSSGQGTIRPQSAHQVIQDSSQPSVEYRFTPSTSVTEVATLNSHASAAVNVMHSGSAAVSFKMTATDGPQVGVDWFLGDAVGFQIGGVDSAGVELVPSFPGGFAGIARVAGFELTLGMTPTVTPILVSTEGALNG